MSVELKLWELQVLQSELETIKVPHARIYKQHPGSLIFFQTDKSLALSACKQEQAKLKKEQEPVSNSKKKGIV